MCFLRSGPSKRLKIIKIRQLFILFLEIQKLIKIHQNSPNFDFAHKTYGFFNIFFLRTSFWAPFFFCFFVVPVFLQKQMVFASFMYYICSSLFHFEISSFMQKNVCFSHFRPQIKNLDISSFVTRPG